VVLRVPKEDLKYGRDYIFLDLYSALSLYGMDCNQILLSTDVIAYSYYGGDKANISPVISKFKKRKGCESITRDLFYIRKVKIKSDNSYFMIEHEYFYKIMNSQNRWDKRLNLLFHYCCIVASINYGRDTMVDGKRGIYGYMSNSFFSRVENVNNNSIMTYNNDLEKMGLIVRIKKRWSDTYNKLLPSIYALKENEELLNKIRDNVVDDPDDYEDLDDLFG